MIELLKIKFQNFFAVGNSPIEIDLSGQFKTLFIGLNGAGKSTINDAICFGLFGRPFKNINKPLMINSINKKNMLVEIDFKSNSKFYTIRRGMKPNILELLEDGHLVKQTASALDYQEYIENYVLKLNFTTFKQIVILGSAVHVPFMKLKAAERREVIENVLDISIISTMNSVLKDKISENKNSLIEIEKQEYANDAKIKSLRKYIDLVEEQKKKESEDIGKRKSDLLAEEESFRERLSKIDVKIQQVDEKIKVKPKIDLKIQNLSNELAILTSEKERHKKTLEFFDGKHICPVCSQEIDESHKHSLEEEADKSIKDIEETQSSTTDEFNKYKKVQKTLIELLDKKEALLNAKTAILTNISNIQNNISLLSSTQPAIGIGTALDDLEIEKQELSKILSEKKDLLDQKEILGITSTLLKDTGIKSKIVAKWIPLINQCVNKYLEMMNFYVQFELDENFNEVIKSRYRDEFVYESFSEGQKARIDLALLFTWREITRTKNSMNVNLLILDEILDTSIDYEGLKDLMKILSNQGKMNLIVISHNPNTTQENNEFFDKTYRFTLEKNFTIMTEEII